MKISISAKCSDMCSTTVKDETGILFNTAGYAPSIDAVGDGDYISLEIDNDTGTIVGWTPLTLTELKEACGIEEEESEDNDW